MSSTFASGTARPTVRAASASISHGIGNWNGMGKGVDLCIGLPDCETLSRETTHAVIMVDTNGVVTSWNDGAETLFGHPASSAVGRRVDFIIPEHLREAHWAGFERAMREPEIKDLAADMPVLCADGKIHEFAGRLLALSDALGTAIGAMAIYVDHGSTGVRPFT